MQEFYTSVILIFNAEYLSLINLYPHATVLELSKLIMNIILHEIGQQNLHFVLTLLLGSIVIKLHGDHPMNEMYPLVCSTVL